MINNEVKILLLLSQDLKNKIDFVVDNNKGIYDNVSVFVRSAIIEKLRNEGVKL